MKLSPQEVYDLIRDGAADGGWLHFAERVAEALEVKRAVATQDDPCCNQHPKAPHGFDRSSSHTLDRYVCDCEGWDPWQAGYDEGFQAGLRYAEYADNVCDEENEDERN